MIRVENSDNNSGITTRNKKNYFYFAPSIQEPFTMKKKNFSNVTDSDITVVVTSHDKKHFPTKI